MIIRLDEKLGMNVPRNIRCKASEPNIRAKANDPRIDEGRWKDREKGLSENARE
jgi:hypothetical protein